MGRKYHILWKIKHVPNHQPESCFCPSPDEVEKKVYPSEKNHLKILWYTILRGVMENHHFCPSKMIVQIFSISWQLQFWFDCSFILCKMVKICVYIRENYNTSPTWIVRPFGDDSPYQPGFQVSGEQWGRYNLPIYIYISDIQCLFKANPSHVPTCLRMIHLRKGQGSLTTGRNGAGLSACANRRSTLGAFFLV